MDMKSGQKIRVKSKNNEITPIYNIVDTSKDGNDILIEQIYDNGMISVSSWVSPNNYELIK